MSREDEKSEIGVRIKQILKDRNVNNEWLADKCGMNSRTITRYVMGQVDMPASSIVKIAVILGANPNWILTGNGPIYSDTCPAPPKDEISDIEEYVMIPRYDVHASAGHGSPADTHEIIHRLAFRRDWIRGVMGLSPEHLAVLGVQGDSMEPTLLPDDTVLVDVSVNSWAGDGLYIVVFDDVRLVKRLQRTAETLIIRSDNPRYHEIVITAASLERLQIWGRVVWIGRRV